MKHIHQSAILLLAARESVCFATGTIYIADRKISNILIPPIPTRTVTHPADPEKS